MYIHTLFFCALSVWDSIRILPNNHLHRRIQNSKASPQITSSPFGSRILSMGLLQEILNELEESGLFEGEVPWPSKEIPRPFLISENVRKRRFPASSPVPCANHLAGENGVHGSSSSDTHGAKPPNEFLLRSTTLPETNIV